MSQEQLIGLLSDYYKKFNGRTGLAYIALFNAVDWLNIDSVSNLYKTNEILDGVDLHELSSNFMKRVHYNSVETFFKQELQARNTANKLGFHYNKSESTNELSWFLTSGVTGPKFFEKSGVMVLKKIEPFTVFLLFSNKYQENTYNHYEFGDELSYLEMELRKFGY